MADSNATAASSVANRKNLRAAFVGIHIHAGDLNPRREQSGYLHTFRSIPGVDVVAYCVNPKHAPPGSGDYAVLQALREVDSRAAFYEDVDELLETEDFDLAVILMPPSEIPPVAEKLARAGKDMYCEKQLARSSAEFYPVVQAVRESGVIFGAGYPWRSHPVARQLRELIQEGVLGEPLSIVIHFATTQVREGSRNPAEWMYRKETEGGGVFHYLGCHFIDLARSLMGCEVIKVSALCSRPVGKIEAGLEDIASVSLEWESGAHGALYTGYVLPPGGPGEMSLIFYGSEGRAKWQIGQKPERLEVWSARWPSSPERAFEFNLRPQARVYGESAWVFETNLAFIEAVRERKKPPATEVDALRVLEVIDAAYRSSAEGRAIFLREVSPESGP